MKDLEALRKDGVLFTEEQETAQQLYDAAVKNGGTLYERGAENEGPASVRVTGRRRKNASMIVNDGATELKLRKGKRGWQDDGAETEAWGVGSIVQMPAFKPDVRGKDRALNRAAQRLLPRRKAR